MLHSAVLTVTCCSHTLPAFCSFRYEDAVSKYEAVMKTEPNVYHFSLLAKERICHALAQVRPLSPAMRIVTHSWTSLNNTSNQCVFCVS